MRWGSTKTLPVVGSVVRNGIAGVQPQGLRWRGFDRIEVARKQHLEAVRSVHHYGRT
jgi:hypothetical protein